MIKKWKPFVLIAVMIIFSICTSSVGAEEIADFEIEWLDTSKFPVNVVYYSTFDNNGEPAGPMWVPDNVMINEAGIVHEPGSFEDDEHAPAYISVIIDSSGSMEGSMQDVLEAARGLIRQFDGQDRAEVIDFDTRVMTRRSFTGDKDSMLSSLGEIEVGGGTALFDSIAIGFDHLRPYRGMKAVIVLSDGEDENSTRYSFDALKPRLQSEGVRVFTIALGQSIDTETMKSIAELSGGSHHQADTADEVGGIYTDIITYLHSLHRLWYSTSLGMFDGSRHELTVNHIPTEQIRSENYRAPSGTYWSHAIDIRQESHAAPIRITPDGGCAAILQYMAVIDAEGRRLTKHRWEEMYDGSMTEQFICGYVHRNYGSLNRYDPEEKIVENVEPQSILADASGDFHREWSWYPKGISPNETYLILSADPDDDVQFDYYFMLFDRKE